MLRNGNEELVEGVEARDRKLARRTPRAAGWRPAALHRCDICQACGPWTESWTWFGSYADLDDGKPVVKLCSKSCREAWKGLLSDYQRRLGAGSKWAHNQFEPVAGQEQRMALYKRRWLAQREMRAHRAFPMPEWPKDRVGNGWCRWCGEEVINRSGRRVGQRSHNRTWHRHAYGDERDCLHEWATHTDIDAQFWHLVARDGPGCAICGPGDGRWVARSRWMNEHAQRGMTYLRWSVKLEVDHVIPLWKVNGAESVFEIRAMHGPGNLWLLCQPCHRRKTGLEASERAQIGRNGEKSAK